MAALSFDRYIILQFNGRETWLTLARIKRGYITSNQNLSQCEKHSISIGQPKPVPGIFDHFSLFLLLNGTIPNKRRLVFLYEPYFRV